VDKPLVLVVDDNEATCTLVTALLQREFAVEVAANGAEAIEKVQQSRYAAVLLDLRMPEVDGFGVLEFLEAERRDLLPKVLVVTAALTFPELDRVRKHAVCGVVAKPFDVDTLLAAVRQCAGTIALGGPLLSGGMILLFADLLRQRWL
jgi:CheY-like chemotaxis protein